MNDQSPFAGQTRFRAADLRPASLDEENRTFDIIWSTGATVRRYSWEDGQIDETLEVSDQAVDLRRLNAGAPVLNSHRSGQLADVIGVVVPGSARIVNGQGLATVQLSARAEVEPILRDVSNGVLRNVSVGYRVEEYQVTRREGARPLYRAVRWEPLEISLVAVPADADAQIRNLSGGAPEAQGETRMNSQPNPALAAPPTIPDPTTAERNRATAILDLGEAHGMVREARAAIDRGQSLELFRASVLDILASRNPTVGISEISPSLYSEAVNARSAVQDMLAGLVDAQHKQVRGRRAASFEDVAVEYCRTHGINAITAAEAVRQYHTTSDFALTTANVLGNMVARRMGQAEPAIVRAARRMTRPHYHAGNLIGLSAASPLQNVNEAGELKHVTVDESGEAMPVPRDLGALFNITEKALRQDVSGVFNQLTDAMVRAAMEKLRTDTLAPLLANSGNGQTMLDGKAMFHADHGNRATAGTALDITNLSAARQAMRLQVDKQGARLAVEPWALVVHPARETIAQQLLAQIDATSVSDVNPFGGKLELIVEPGLTNDKGWYLVANPADYEGLAVATLEGLETPSIQSRPAWGTIGLEMRVVWALDARFVETATWYYNPGA